jgi:hypothetical protein
MAGRGCCAAIFRKTAMVATTIYPAGRYSFSFAINLPGV